MDLFHMEMLSEHHPKVSFCLSR
uniref:Uncharacterized protein n=1 Tax=Arundo donax TaxID=35708 RepID=A0A0A9F667_ARUDO